MIAKYFNTTGSCVPDLHYMLPAAERITHACRYIDRGQYFVLHAPRQTGKTTSLIDLARQLTDEGKYAALYFSCESAEPAGDDYEAAERIVIDTIRTSAFRMLPLETQPHTPWPSGEPGRRLVDALTTWASECPRPLVLFFDEIDAIRGQSLRSVLRQLRAGYNTDRQTFPHSIVLCGLRDVRDYKTEAGGDPSRLGSSSPFNIKVESIRLGDFTKDQVAALYSQHTAATGQEFNVRAIDLAYHYTQGQPWLVNALAAEVIDNMGIEGTITDDDIDTAKERLIRARATHLDSLVAKLTEPRVQRVIEPLLAGSTPMIDLAFNDDAAYVRDLGLIAVERPIRVANPIYNEVIVRVLGDAIENAIFVEPSSFRLPDGRLDFDRLLREFAVFWRQNGEVLTFKDGYHEVAAQLIMMAFLHRIVNGGGFIDREYGLGYKRVDLLVRQPYTGADGRRAWQREALELKVWHPGEEDPLAEGLTQLDTYLTRLTLDSGTLVIFDRRPDVEPLADRVEFSETISPAGRSIIVLRA